MYWIVNVMKEYKIYGLGYDVNQQDHIDQNQKL